MEPSPNRSVASRGRRLCVLLADDDRDTLEGFALYLKTSGVDVETAETGPNTLRLARALLPDVIVVDLYMPGMDGLDVVDALKSRRETAAIPVVLFSGTDRGDVCRLADACVTKPCAPSELLAVVRKLGGRA